MPRPRLADESRRIVPVPCLIIDFVDGATITEPAQVAGPRAAFTGQLAAALASIHQAGVARSDVPHLAEIRGHCHHQDRNVADIPRMMHSTRQPFGRRWRASGRRRR